MEPNSEIKLVRVSEATFPCSLFKIAKLAFWAGLCQLDYGIPTFDSESFELELNGIPGGTSGSSFVQNPSVFLEIRFRPMYTMRVGLP